MESRFTHATLTLSKFGDSIEIKVFSRNATEEDNIHPLLKKGLACNGYDQILTLLKEIQNNDECLQSVYLAHRNNHLYRGHMFYPPEVPHPESIETMIAFVEERKLNPEVPQESYMQRMATQIVDSVIKDGCKIM